MKFDICMEKPERNVYHSIYASACTKYEKVGYNNKEITTIHKP